MTECVKIKCDDCKFVEDCVDYGWQGCKKFTPAPSTPITNEEWRKTCSAEEFAGALTKVVLNIVAWNNDPKPSEVRNVLKSWLKQPYKPIS